MNTAPGNIDWKTRTVDGMPIPSVDAIAERWQRECPAIFKRCYTRHIDSPGNYRGFKAVATTFTGCILETNHYLRQQRLVSNGNYIFHILEKYDHPVYFVSAPLLQAMACTHPPTGMTYKDIVWPFEGIMFMIPRGVLKEPSGAEIYMLGICHFPGTDMEKAADLPKWMRDAGAHQYERTCVFWMMEPAGVMMHDCTFPSSQALEPDPKWIDEATAAQIERGNVPDGIVSGDFAARMAGIAANLLLVMQARPELVEKGGGDTKRRLPKSGAPIHTPTFIGRKYAIRREEPKPGLGGGHFTELRWRAGHLRNQPYGKGRLERKIIFIEPYIAYSAGLVRETPAEETTTA